MPLSYMLRQIGRATGLALTDESQRALAVDWINQGAEAVWESTDLQGSLRECIFPVQSNLQIAFPSFVFRLRAMREYRNFQAWRNLDMRPRYHNATWDQMWSNWRQKHYAATQMSIQTVGPLTLAVKALDDTPPTVSISGETTDAKNLIVTSEVSAAGGWTLSSGVYSKSLNTTFTEIKSIKKDIISTYDITIYDVNANVLAVLDNNQLSTQYLIVDVSQYPFGGDCPDDPLKKLMEVLYKPRFNILENDDDEFPIPDYDDVVVFKTLQLYYEEQEGGEKKAIYYDARSNEEIRTKMHDMTGGIEQAIEFKPHPHDSLVSRRRYVPYSNMLE